MKRILPLLLLLALPTFAETPREIYPSDYKPQPCAKDICKSLPREEFVRQAGAYRRLPIRQEWVDAHWDEMLTSFRPLCARIANCMAVPGNDWLFCVDFMRLDFLATADRYPKGTDDHDQWKMSALMFFIGLDKALIAAQPESQNCAREQRSPGERKLEVWADRAKIGPDYSGYVTFYAIDAETRIPVKAYITVEGQTLKPADDSPDGRPMAFYKFPWPIRFNEVANAEGHRDLVVPNVILKADGYEVAMLPMPIEVPKVIVEMKPPASQLVAGPNQVTVTAHDAVTGLPVEMRVFAGQKILGNTNKPITVELASGQKRPEIWATSLFHRYSDVIVAQGE